MYTRPLSKLRFHQRRIGAGAETLDRNQVVFRLSTQGVSGIVKPGQHERHLMTILRAQYRPAVQISWGTALGLNDLGISVYAQSGIFAVRPILLICRALGKRESLTICGRGRKREYGVLECETRGRICTPQQFYGTLEIGRARYAEMSDVNYIESRLAGDIYQSLRSLRCGQLGTSSG